MAVEALHRPVAGDARVENLDLIRGVAVLAILLMNVQSFAMPDAAYRNPRAYGDLSGLNALAWCVIHVLVAHKFLALFSLLFGAGIHLFMRPGDPERAKPIGLHYRRMGWLLLFGVAHFVFLWWGDILMSYALGGSIAILFLRLPGPALLAGAGAFLLLGLADEVNLLKQLRDPAAALSHLAATWQPTAEELSEEIALLRSGWWNQVVERSFALLGRFDYGIATPIYVLATIARVTGLMLLGMYLMRTGFLSLRKPDYVYQRLAAVGVGLGGLLVVSNLAANVSASFSPEYNLLWGRLVGYVGNLLMALGYLGILSCIMRTARGPGLHARVQAVGRMAFTNYIAQSALATWVFYGFGLGLFGQVDRAGQVGVAAAIIALQLVWSPWLLRRLHLGPLEWAWRCLTYARWQPLLRRERVATGPSAST